MIRRFEYGNRAALVAKGETLTAALADAVRGDGKRLYAGRAAIALWAACSGFPNCKL